MWGGDGLQTEPARRDVFSVPPASVTRAGYPYRNHFAAPPQEAAARTRAALSASRRPLEGARRAAQRRAFGATNRVPDQSLPALTVEVCDSPAVGADSPISLGST
jgi:hypothetical protein